MSDTPPERTAPDLAGSLRPSTLRRYTDPEYSAPTWEDVQFFMHLAQLSASGVADLVGVSSRTVRKWTSPTGSPNNAPIPYAAWRLLLVEKGCVS
jgi:DNA-binding transcriptional regulator YiaG